VPSYYSFSLASILVVAMAAPAMAQERPAPTVAPAGQQGGVIAYTAADFAAARPNTALDMINRLPGFAVDSGDQVRGFAGAAGNVLIDGQRPTSKSDSVQDILGRIPIAQVERIDLIRGGAPGIDMQGRTVIANVIRKRVDTFQQTFQVGSFIFADTGHTIPSWNYQASRRAGETQLDFSLSRGNSYDDSVGKGWRTTVDPVTGQGLFENSESEADGVPHSLRATYKTPLAGGTFSINGVISNDEFKSEDHFFSATTDDRLVSRSYNDRGEIGVNYKRDLSPKWEIEALALSKIGVGSFDGTGDTIASSSLFQSESESGESIGRTILRYKLSPEWSFEGGGEVAFNYREQQIALTVSGSPVALPAADVRVEELRGEVFAQGTWRPDPKLQLEAGVRFERSTITETGDVELERSFNYPKPRVVATWSPTKNDQLRLRVEREVGQLDFEDFISSVDLGTRVLSAGNAELEPDKTWAYEAAFEKRFWGSAAAVLTLRHEDITDVVDVFPFLALSDANGDGIPDDLDNNGQPDLQLVTGPGNIGDGTNDVIELNVTLPLENVGIKGGELRLESQWQKSEVTDPLTGESRRISGQRPNNVELSYRQDLPEYKLSYGFTWFAGWNERHFRLREVQSLDLNNFYGSFIEWKPTTNFTLRAELNNLVPYKFNIVRSVFDGPRDTGNLDFIEKERRNSQVIGLIRARWTFQ
jgi:hypothetical protein